MTASPLHLGGETAPPETGRNPVLGRLSWQAALFGPMPKRGDLSALTPDWPLRRLDCRVHRNHGFELVAGMIEPYLNFAGLSAAFRYSAYDDSLNFQLDGKADLEIVWLDLLRYEGAKGVASWLEERLAVLANESDAPILAVWTVEGPDGSVDPAIPNVYIGDLDDVRRMLGPRLFDLRAAAHSGTRLSNMACILAGRLIGSRWIPALFRPSLKAIVLDLDNTLYDGVLGEDGPDGVRLTPGHLALQAGLKSLKDQGIFLALASRNEPDDVRRLFELRTDFALGWDDFSHRAIGWGDKADAIMDAAHALRIGADAILFVDDNPGELLAVAGQLPEANLLRAGPGGEQTANALHYFPGLFKWRRTADDALRVADLNAAAARDDLRGKAASRVDYFKSLGVELFFSIDEPSHLARAAQLSNKTNQFNLSLRRFDEKAARVFIDAANKSLVTVSLRDRLSDSGLVAAIFAWQDGDSLIVEDLCISCRALGRDIETVMVLEACRAIAERLGTTALAFRCAKGPRNDPARAWLDAVAGKSAPVERGLVRLAAIPDIEAEGIVITWATGEGSAV